MQPDSPLVRFGVFEVDLKAGEVRKQGRRVRLGEQPFQVLAALLERPGQVVTRDELREKLWPADVNVDFDHSLNKAVNKLREALGDSSETPRFIETLPRRGYRFLTTTVEADSGREPNRSESPIRSELEGVPERTRFGARTRVWPIGIGLVAAVVTGWVYLTTTRASRQPAGKVMLAVMPFQNLAESSDQDYFSDGMTEEMIAQLGQLQPERLGVIARTSAMVYKNRNVRADIIGRELGVDYLLEGSVRRTGETACESRPSSFR